MNRQHCAELFDQLWPKNDWSAPAIKEFWRRANDLDLSTEQVHAVFLEHRMTSRSASPIPSDLLGKLKVAAAGEHAHRAIASDAPTQPVERPVTMAEFRAWAAQNGAKVHPMLAGKIGKQEERRR